MQRKVSSPKVYKQIYPKFGTKYWLPGEVWEYILAQLPFLRRVQMWQAHGVMVLDSYCLNVHKATKIIYPSAVSKYDLTMVREKMREQLYQGEYYGYVTTILVKYPRISELVYSSVYGYDVRTVL